MKTAKHWGGKSKCQKHNKPVGLKISSPSLAHVNHSTIDPCTKTSRDLNHLKIAGIEVYQGGIITKCTGFGFSKLYCLEENGNGRVTKINFYACTKCVLHSNHKKQVKERFDTVHAKF